MTFERADWLILYAALGVMGVCAVGFLVFVALMSRCGS
jgi:hypothetical protein